MYETKKLYRSKKNRIIFGVCGGLAEYYNVDATIVRVGWIFMSIIFSFPILVYLILFFVVPEEGVKRGKDKRESELKDFANSMPSRMQGFVDEIKNRKKAYNSKFDWVKIGIAASVLILVFKIFVPHEEISSIIFVVGTLVLIYYIAKNKNWIKNNVNFDTQNKKNYYSNDIIRMQKNSQKDFPIREILFILFLIALLLIYLINNHPWFAEQYVNIKEWMFSV